INLPINVTNRYLHSLSVWSVTPTTNWIIEFGGLTECTHTAVIELRHSSDNDWSTSVISLDQYQDQLRRRILSDWENLGLSKEVQLLTGHLQERERELYEEQLQREIKEKEQIQQDRDKEQQQLLQEKATLSQQLDDATTLLEQAEIDKSTLELDYEKLKAKVADNEEKKQIITENYEKLKLKIADMEEQYLNEKQIFIHDNQNLISEKDKVIAKLTSQVEEQSQNEKQIITDLRAKVSDNELYTTKLMKEKSQLQERVTSLEEQSIKETSSIALQFNYLIPAMDKLDCLSDVQVAERKLFLIQGDKPQLMNWEKYGLRIGVQKESLLSSETVEAAVVALVGGQFQFPPNTVLVSAVYAVSLSKPLLKRLILEIQHCIDLTGRPALSRHLKFAIAPVSTPSLPYQFFIVEGGEFNSDSWYGSIQRKEFCLVAIVGEKYLPKSSTNGDESEEEEEEQEEEAEEETEEEVVDGNSDSSSDPDNTKDPPGCSNGGQGESTSNEGVEEEGETGGQPLHEEGKEEQENERVEESKDHEEPQHEEATAPIPCTESSLDFNSKMVLSTGIVENMTYAGQVYYEEKRAKELVTFSAAKKLRALIEFIEKKRVQAEIDQHVYFSFIPSYSYIELKFDAPQNESFTGWSIKPHLKPCRLRRCDVDNFGDATYPVPPSCLISIYGSSVALSSLHYSVPLVGVVDPVTLLIHCSLRTAPPLPLPSKNPTTSSSTVVHESTALSRASTFRSDIACSVMTECTSLIKNCGIDIHFLVDKLLEHNIINAREKRGITDGYTKQTAGERMDELLHIVSSSICMEGEVFGIFLDILREEVLQIVDFIKAIAF
uniref:CARD domain-containing protein n=1 Tax=Amphimedon queenslandica TaxID=400682 RepID=A0A1X7VT80_AMPQE